MVRERTRRERRSRNNNEDNRIVEDNQTVAAEEEYVFDDTEFQLEDSEPISTTRGFNLKKLQKEKEEEKERNKYKKNIFMRFLYLFSKEKREIKKEKKLKSIANDSSFKPFIFLFYIILFFSSVSYFVFYIVSQDSKYETINKKLLVIHTKEEPVKTKAEIPLISTEEDENIIIEENQDSQNILQNYDTYTIENSIPTSLAKKKLEFAPFLEFTKTSRNQFCKFAEQASIAYMLANAESRNYAYTSSPLNNIRVNYSDCMNKDIWEEPELFALYENLYNDYIDTKTEDDKLLQKLVATKNYKLYVDFNSVRDFPIFLSSNLLTEDQFDNILKKSFANQFLLCRYSIQFSKSYDKFVSKRTNSLRPISNCYSKNINLKEAYTQYVFYYNYIQSNSTDINAKELASGLIPNYMN